VAESNVAKGDKSGALEIISALGKDVKQADGQFRFIFHEHVVHFFCFFIIWLKNSLILIILCFKREIS
jgi:hypothetical protein